MSKQLVGIFAILALTALPALAKPDFTGDWKLNTSKSTFGDVPPPDSMTIKVTHGEPKLSTVSKQSGQMGEIEMKGEYTTDGKECTNEGFQGAPMKSVVKWDGDVLGFETKGQFGGEDFTLTQKWTLSDDGKTLTVAQHIATSMGDFDQKLIFDRQ
jgi:hypothetical protein